MESGNPSRFIRRALVDENQQFEFIETSPEEDSLTQDEVFISLLKQPNFLHSSVEDIISNMKEFNKGMTNALVVEVQDMSARSALNTCQFSRARMSSLEIINMLQATLVNFEIANVAGVNDAIEVLNPAVLKSSVLFNKIFEDLHFFDPVKHGEAMQSLSNAAKEFTVLRTALTLIE